MKLSLRADLGGYGVAALQKTDVDGTTLDKPFVLFTGPNGSGKSAVLRGIRASLGIRGDRHGYTDTPHQRQLDPAEHGADDVERLATQKEDFGGIKPFDYVPAVFKLADLGWAGQPTFFFDSREASNIAGKGEFSDDMLHHISLIAGGGSKASHGQFVSRSWWEAVEWAAGFCPVDDPYQRGHLSPSRQAILNYALNWAEASQERWLFIDEPETAIDAEALLLGLCILLKAAEIGKLRVFCASHSLLFAAGLAKHDKVQVIDLGEQQSWLQTQGIALRVAGDMSKVDKTGDDMLARIAAARAPQPKPKRPRFKGADDLSR